MLMETEQQLLLKEKETDQLLPLVSSVWLHVRS